MAEPTLLVIGAGPAGAAAALAAQRHGVAVTLIDEAAAAGGQVWRAPPASFAMDAAKAGPEFRDGEALRRALAASGVRLALGRRVWLAKAGFELRTVGAGGTETFRAPALVVATGTWERIIPFPGAVLPGVIGLGAATILLKSQQVLPGRRTVVAGCGPLLAAVAAGILKGGGTVAALIDLNGPGDWLARLPALRREPGLLGRGLGWMARIRAAGVPILWRHAVVGAEGDGGVAAVVAAPVDGDWRPVPGGAVRRFAADALAVGHGLVPSTELTRLLGAEHVLAPASGGWVARCDAAGRTSIGGLYLAGDAAGIAGAATASLRGELAGLAAARDLGALDAAGYEAAAAVTGRLARRQRFGRAMAGLMALRPGLVETITPETVVCRCEDIDRATIDEALASGAAAVGQLKSWTRCGMGPCQGRMCGESVAALAAARGIPRERFGQIVARPPLRPVPLEAMTGDYTYDDIGLPPSLPA